MELVWLHRSAAEFHFNDLKFQLDTTALFNTRCKGLKYFEPSLKLWGRILKCEATGAENAVSQL